MPKAKARSTASLLIALVTLVGLFTTRTKMQTLWTEATGQKARLEIDLSLPTIDPLPYWQNLAQGGESPDFTLAPISSALSELKPSYIRLDHIFDFYVSIARDSKGELQYDFSKLDRLITEIRAVNAVPFISLSYMPPILNSDLTGAPSAWSDWEEVITATVAHISSPTGLNLSGVYYEVWNEPDLFGKWKTTPPKNYLELYESTVRAIAVVPNVLDYKVGGPATTALYPNWVTSLLDLVSKNGLRLDFYSWHHYNEDPEALNDELLRFQKLVAKYPQFKKLEVVVSEWGHESELDPRFDSPFAAAHTLATLASINAPIHQLFTFEAQDGVSPDGRNLWGRWGLLSADGKFKKPRFHALKIANLFQFRRLSVSGQGTWVKAIASKPRSNSLRLLVVNYDPAETHTETVPIIVKNIRPGSYQLTKAFLNRPPQTAQIEIAGTTHVLSQTLLPQTVMFLELMPLASN